MASEIYLNSARMVAETNCASCAAIFHRVGGHGFSNAAYYYRRMFEPPRKVDWWNGIGPDAQEARIYALLLAHNMHLTGDI